MREGLRLCVGGWGGLHRLELGLLLESKERPKGGPWPNGQMQPPSGLTFMTNLFPTILALWAPKSSCPGPQGWYVTMLPYSPRVPLGFLVPLTSSRLPLPSPHTEACCRAGSGSSGSSSSRLSCARLGNSGFSSRWPAA